MLGPDPASADRATVGGSVANNATGSHSIFYGMMADHVLATSVILANGSLARFGPVEPDMLATKARVGGLEGQIYANVPAIVRQATRRNSGTLAQALASRVGLQSGSPGRSLTAVRSARQTEFR